MKYEVKLFGSEYWVARGDFLLFKAFTIPDLRKAWHQYRIKQKELAGIYVSKRGA